MTGQHRHLGDELNVLLNLNIFLLELDFSVADQVGYRDPTFPMLDWSNILGSELDKKIVVAVYLI